MDLIAYVDPERRVNTIRPNGAESTRISPDEEGLFTWPAWSPDGARIVFSGFLPGPAGDTILAMYLYDGEEPGPTVVFTNEPGTGPVLPGMPHYPLWSPDGRRVAFMAGHPRGLSLFMVTPGSGDDAEVALTGNPLYASWMADSQRLLVHAGLDHYVVEPGQGAAPTDLKTRTAGYRAAAPSPSGDEVVIAAADEFRQYGLYISDIDLAYRTGLGDLEGESAFVWSPDGTMVALARSDVIGGGVYRGVTLFSTDGEALPATIDEEVMAFFWSPDSSRLAYVTITEGRSGLRWSVMDVANGSRTDLTDFLPSQEQMTMVRFFDQFSYSHRPWSPDSSSLVFSGWLLTDGGGTTETQPGIFVLDAGLEPSTRSIAQGSMAVWSPR